MTGFNIVMIIAVILFVRLGVRLFTKWNELKKQDKDENEPFGKLRDQDENEDGEK